MKVFNDFKEALAFTKKGEFFIFYRGVLFPFKWQYKGSNKTVMFLPGRTARDRKPVPVFQRSSYFDDIDANVISCFDPTLFWSKSLTLGWFQGRGSIFYGELLGELVSKITNVFKTKNENFFIYATSGGGIPGFNIAKKLKGCTLYVSNIQIDASKYHEKFFKQMIDISYPKMSEKELFDGMHNRFSAVDIDEEFNLVYSQNKSDVFHCEKHFNYYRQRYSNKKNIKADFYLYDDPLTGHDPLPKESELLVIKNIMDGKSLEKILPNAIKLTRSEYEV